MDLHYASRMPNSSAASSSGMRHLDPETDFKVRHILSNVTDTAHMAGNEPTMGLFRIQEHVHRTLPHIVHRKAELKKNLAEIEGATYDLSLSIDVVDSISKIQNFTRIKEALITAIETKRKLDLREEQERARRELDTRNAQMANRSLSHNEHAEGYICPVCYFALTSQDDLISHWQKEHSLSSYENDVFQEVSMPIHQLDGSNHEFVVEQDNDLTVIDMPIGNKDRSLSTAEDVVKSFNAEEEMFHETNEESASDASGDLIGQEDENIDLIGQQDKNKDLIGQQNENKNLIGHQNENKDLINRKDEDQILTTEDVVKTTES